MILILGKKDIVEYIEELRERIRKEQNLQTGDEISKEDFIRLYNLYGFDLSERIFARYVLDISYQLHSSLLLGKQNVTKVFGKEKITSEYIEKIKKEVIDKNNLHINDGINYQDFVRIYNSCEHKLDMFTFASKILEISGNNFVGLKTRAGKTCKVLRRTKFSNTEILQCRKILKENENIDDDSQITYVKVLELYEKYGGCLNENDFVRKVLEIPKHMHNNIRKNPQRLVTIKYKENLHSEEELKKIRTEIAKCYNLHVDDKISKKLFLEIYEKYKGDLTESRFAYDVLGISINGFKNMYQNDIETKIFETEKLTENEIIEIRNKMIREEKLKSETRIDYDKFKQLYKKYGDILSAEQFAEYILDMKPTSLSNIKTTEAVILREELPDFKTLINITNRVMDEYNLKIGDNITYSLFLEIYNKYGGNMSIKQFEEDIFDISSKTAFKESDNDRTNIIMPSTVIPDEYIRELRTRVILENKLLINGSIEKEEFEYIYERYSGRLGKKIFAEQILDISDSSLYSLLNGTCKSVTILSKETLDYAAYKELREQIIEEFHLHIKDFIDYEQFTTMYQKYGGTLKEREFALVMLDIKKQNFNNIKYIEGARTRILLEEEVSLDEIAKLRKFFKQYEGRMINYDEFKEFHFQYGGKMDEFSFCEQVLGFKLNFIKYYNDRAAIKNPVAKEKSIEIRKKFADTKCRFFSKEEVETICRNSQITVEDFLKYVVLKYNFQFYPETLEAYEKNRGIWFGGKKISLSTQFLEEHAEKMMQMSETAIKTISKGYKISEEVRKDIASDVLVSAIERYGELERNFSYNYEELCKRIYIRMRIEAKRKLVSHWKVSSKDASGKYYFRERVGPDIQIGEYKNSRKVEDIAIENVDNKKIENKIFLSVKKLSELGIDDEKIGETLMEYLSIDKLELIKILKKIREKDEETLKSDLDELSFAGKIIEKYKEHGVDIDYSNILLTFYIKKISKNDMECFGIIDKILIASKICTSRDKNWKEMKRELTERKMEPSTIAIALSVCNDYYKNEEKTKGKEKNMLL